LEGTFKGHLI